MEAQIAQFANRGMNQDISVSKASNEFAFRNYNIRITAVNDNTLLSVTNEKLPLKIDTTIKGYPANTIEGSYLGHAILNDTLVLFTHSDEKDYIWKFEYKEGELNGRILYEGQLGFDLNYPIETLAYYESENIQKVYWVDGNNLTRFINIKGDIKNNLDTQFDFSPTINSFPAVTIKKEYNGAGLFPSGVIQYALSYYNKFGAETGLVYLSDLQYITEKTTGESPEESVVCNFELSIENVDTNFDFIRLYSIIRTSLNGEPLVQIVDDIPINGEDTINYSDFNLKSELVDPTLLLYLNTNNIIASTLNQKDNTLFLGNLKVNDAFVDSYIENIINNNIIEANGLRCYKDLKFKHKKFYTSKDSNFQLLNSSKEVTTYKRGELYRFAIQFQDTLGVWTNPIFLGDMKCEISPEVTDNEYLVASVELNLNSNLQTAIGNKYINYRLLMAETSHATRSILAQGIVTPTIFNHAERVNKSGPYSIASWLMRPRNGKAQFEHLSGLSNIKTTEGYKNVSTCEIQNALEAFPAVKLSSGSSYTNNYYVDSSILNFYSPDIKNNEDLFKDANLKFRIVGIVPVTDSTYDIELSTNTSGWYSGAGLVKNAVRVNRTSTSRATRDRVPSETPDDEKTIIDNTFTNSPLYLDSLLSKEGNFIKGTAKYHLYLWNKKGSIIGQTGETKDGVGEDAELVTTIYSDLKHKIVANKRECDNIIYFNKSQILNYNINPTVFNSTEVDSKVLNLYNNKGIYQGNYETLLATRAEDNNRNYSYRVFFTDPEQIATTSNRRPSGIGSSSTVSNRIGYNHTDLEQYDPVSIKYKTTEHLVFSLKSNTEEEYKILPYLEDNNESVWDIKSLYEGFNFPETIAYPWFENNETYTQDKISGITIDKPYFYIGEIYRDMDIHIAYGGYNKTSMQKINWIPISDAFKINDSVINTVGDTYFQTWDCLSVYPFTEEDLNSIVDITSFKLETHVNLDGRYDASKEINNIINARPTNFNLINNVYSQTNNYFNYTILEDKFKQLEYNNQIAFSLQKTPTSDIDIWTNITLASTFNLNGLYGKLNRIVNFNDVLVTFQDKAISVINFNNQTALSTEAGVPIEIANSGKVNGYSVASSTTGCQNKWSICNATSGIYFIDDYNKTLMRFNKEGLSNVSSNGMSMWFKNNLTSTEKVFSDGITGDIYITNTNNCIIYNEALQSFTSFMDYYNIDLLFNLNSHSFILNKENTMSKMFDGNYTSNYSIEYKINPEPYSYNTFTNVEYTSDCLPENRMIDSIPRDKRLNKLNLPFDKLEVWNEYQYGITSIKDRFTYPNFETKFRKWRVDVPRDLHSKNSLGRIKNPWILLKLSNTTEHTDKMVFHDLIVKYYN